MLFLEAGPPFGLGAHPCAFIDNVVKLNDRREISVRGVCLAQGGDPLPIEDFLPSSDPLASASGG